MADLKLRRLLDTFDQWATEAGAEVPGDPERLAATEVPGPVPLALDLRSGEIQTIIWATGFRPDQSWLNAPVFDRKGRVSHDGGVNASPGLHLMGMPFLRRRKSSLIDGAGTDAAELTGHLVRYLDAPPPPRVVTGDSDSLGWRQWRYGQLLALQARCSAWLATARRSQHRRFGNARTCAHHRRDRGRRHARRGLGSGRGGDRWGIG